VSAIDISPLEQVAKEIKAELKAIIGALASERDRRFRLKLGSPFI
jgi:hypothetical protein